MKFNSTSSLGASLGCDMENEDKCAAELQIIDELRVAIAARLLDGFSITELISRRNAGLSDSRSKDEMSEFAALGWLSIAVPEEFGGLGLSIRELSVLMQLCGKFRVNKNNKRTIGTRF